MIDFKGDTKYQEQIIEYKFISDLMIHLAHQSKKLELMRVHTDSFGYDLILKIDDEIRYIQLKSRAKDGKANYWDVHKSLLKNENGIVLVILYEFGDGNLNLEYLYLPKEKYEETISENPKYKKDEEKYCKVSKKNLKVLSISEFVESVFQSPDASCID